MTFNGNREPASDAKAFAAKNPADFAGRYIAPYKVRYDVLAPDVAVTTWENDFARIAPDGTRRPMQLAMMTIVWKRTSGGWRILDYHESTRPKALDAPAARLSRYVGTYRDTDGTDVRVAVANGRLTLAFGESQPISLEAFADPDFGMRSGRVTFVRNRDGAVQGVLLARGDGSSSYAWRVPKTGSPR